MAVSIIGKWISGRVKQSGAAKAAEGVPMIGPISSETGLFPKPALPELASRPTPAAPSGFDDEAVRIDLKAALEPIGRPTSAKNLSPRQLLAKLMQGFQEARRAGHAIQQTFQAIRSKVQAFGLDLIAKRAEGLQKGAALLTLLGKTPDSVAEEAESLAKQAEDKAGKTQKSLLAEDRLARLSRPFSTLAEKIARFQKLDEAIGAISFALKLTSLIHRGGAETREEDEAAAKSEHRIDRSLRNLHDLKSDPQRYSEPPRLNLKV